MKKNDLKNGAAAILLGFSAVGIGGKWVWDRRSSITHKVKSIFFKAQEKFLSRDPLVDLSERERLLKIIKTDKQNILNSLIGAGKDLIPDVEIIRNISNEKIKGLSKHSFNLSTEKVKKIELKKQNLDEEIYSLTYELTFSILQNLFYKKKNINFSLKKIETDLVLFFILSEFAIEFEKEKLEYLENLLKNFSLDNQLNKNRINKTTELILSRIFNFFKDIYAKEIVDGQLDKKDRKIKTASDIVRSLSDLELIRLNKIRVVFNEKRFIDLTELISEFKSITKPINEIESLLLILDDFSNRILEDSNVDKLTINESVNVLDLLKLIEEKSKTLLVSEKTFEILKIFLKEPKGGKRVNWNCSFKDIEEKLLIKININDLKNIKNAIALEWFNENNFIIIPSPEQLQFIVNSNNSIKLTARAGSGKTTTVSLKVLFLVHFCGIKTNEILITTFNSLAAKELEDKIQEIEFETKLSEKPNKYFVYNFDKICYSIIGQRQVVLQGDDEIKAINYIIQSIFAENNNESKRIKKFILKAFKSDWTEWLNDNKNKLTPLQLNELRSNSSIKLINGIRVKSLGEKRIGDFLLEHNIKFKYEEPINKFTYKNYMPEFYIPEFKCVIEFFGMKGDAKYDEQTRKKIKDFESQKELSLIEIYPKDLLPFGNDFLFNKEEDYSTLTRKIKESIGEDVDISSRRINDEEIIEALDYEKGSEAFKYFSRLYQNVMERTQQRCSNYLEVMKLVSDYKINKKINNKLEEEFVDLIPSLYIFYKNQLKSLGKTNFTEIKWKAISLLKEGKKSFTRDNREILLEDLEFIFIDEFQDFSSLYQEIISNIIGFSNKIKVNAVGDDMQLINGFMGSELKFFNEFSENFSDPIEMTLTENRRSAKKIIDFCNQIILNNSQYLGENFAISRVCEDKKDLKGRITNFDLASLIPENIEMENFDADKLIISLMRSIDYSKKFFDSENKMSNKEISFFILSRFKELITIGAAENMSFIDTQNRNNELIKNIIDKVFFQISSKSFQIKTAHKSKGGEAKSVIIPNIHNFPVIHPSSQFLGIFGDTPKTLLRDELKLLYVACSRAEQDLIFISNSRKEDYDFYKILPKETSWGKAEKKYEIFGDYFKIEIKIINSKQFYEVKDEIYDRGFTYNPIDNNWKKIYKNKGVCIEEITKIKSSLNNIDKNARVSIRFLDSNNDLEIEMKLPDKDNWNDYLNSYKLNLDMIKQKSSKGKMELKSEIAFSYYLGEFSFVFHDSVKLNANQILLDKISLNTNPSLIYENEPDFTFINYILEIFYQIKTIDLLEIYSNKIINDKNFQEIMDSEKDADIAIYGSERNYYSNLETFQKDLNFEACVEVITKSMEKALSCDSDEEFPEEYKALQEHKKKLAKNYLFDKEIGII